MANLLYEIYLLSIPNMLLRKLLKCALLKMLHDYALMRTYIMSRLQSIPEKKWQPQVVARRIRPLEGLI